ncbi:salicylate carboxymethyltransferase-like [Senna tora]|uniref:Salicylate carboxymethyltransferase-like n=1 Tax=Senna tora TaxID=362788 RepID=A0A834W8R6_9FABA|nr:salicylate carboxymethyltransferase-like [Senna tora]
MEVAQVLHMNGGMGESSYANNSLLQQKVLCMTKWVREEAVSNLYRDVPRGSLAIADLGCSSGPNTFFVVSEVIKHVERLCLVLKIESPQYTIFLNDLPGNDFNNIFKSLGSFKNKLNTEIVGGIGPCFFNGVPGSFYGRLFPPKSLHFVHSSYSLHWLSQVPEGVENNKGNIYLSTRSPPNVFKAYYHQFQRDFSMFLKCRAEEVVEGGYMVLTFSGRKVEDPSTKDGCYIWELLAIALNHMVSERIIKEEEVDSFNIPYYSASPSEVEREIVKEGSFNINRINVCEVNWDASGGWDPMESESEVLVSGDRGYSVAKFIRAVAEPLLLSHFGEDIIEQVFKRYQQILTDRMSKEKTQVINNITVSMTRK